VPPSRCEPSPIELQTVLLPASGPPGGADNLGDVVAVKANDGRLDHGDADRLHTCELVGSEIVRAVAEQDDVV
jgi:hypothetical protein